ncbi:SPFH/Band 7/PHB domain protein [Xanthomonas phage JGB6]|nr:SPFH/Band 7/PHB domain protein [Xanthomonas phage JGB6]
MQWLEDLWVGFLIIVAIAFCGTILTILLAFAVKYLWVMLVIGLCWLVGFTLAQFSGKNK